MRLGIIVLFLVNFLYSCGNRHFDVEEGLDRVVNPISTKKTYSFLGDKGIQEIFQAKCNMCHKTGGMNPKDWTEYKVTKANLDLINKRLFIDADMPMVGELTALEKKMIKTWMKEGAPLNKESFVSKIDDPSSEVRFEGNSGIKNILSNKCMACHNGSFHPKDWTNYEVAKNNLMKIEKRLFVVKDMPMVGSLSDEEKIKLKEWILAGGPF